jgi:hypothetical protein
MDDIGWCPQETCTSLANLDLDENTGRCQHCEFLFCLDCRESVHPYRRCPANRIDLVEDSQLDKIAADNKQYEEVLNQLYMKFCTKRCPNIKCGVRIARDPSGCTQVTCSRCFQQFCWACSLPAKGQKHYKEKPECIDEIPHILPKEVTDEMIEKNLGFTSSPFINIRYCARCPKC